MGCRNGAEGAGGGVLESADRRPANWRSVAARGLPVGSRQPARVDGRWWPGAHNSAPKAHPTYAAESQSGSSRGTRVGGENNQEIALYMLGTGGSPEDRLMRRREGRQNRPDPKLPSRYTNCHCEFSRQILPQLWLLPSLPAPATLAPSQAGTGN